MAEAALLCIQLSAFLKMQECTLLWLDWALLRTSPVKSNVAQEKGPLTAIRRKEPVVRRLFIFFLDCFSGRMGLADPFDFINQTCGLAASQKDARLVPLA